MSLFNLFNRIILGLQQTKIQKLLRLVAPYVVVICLILGLLAYINIVPGSASYFYSGTTLGIVVRALSFFILFVYCLLCVISLKIRPNYSLIVVYIFLMLLNFIMVFISPHYYETLYLSQYTRVGTYFITSMSNKSIMMSYVVSLADFSWGFCFLWILPQLFKDKKQLLLIFLFYIFVMDIVCLCSFFKEKDIYILIFTDPSKIGSATGLHSLFDTKQTFGVFLCPAFCSSLLSAIFVFRRNTNSLFKSLIGIFLVISNLLIFFVSMASLCRTAIFGNVIMLFVFYIALVITCLIKKKWIIGSSLALVGIGLIVTFVMFMTVEKFHSSGLLANLYVFLKKNIFGRVSTSADSRLTIVVAYLREIPILNLFFGFSKGLQDIYVRSLAPILRYGLHSGFVIYLGNYGVISFFLTYLLVIRIMWGNLKNIKKDPLIVLTLFGSFMTAMFVNISELEILVFSSSTTVFMFNYIILVVGDSKYQNGLYLNMTEAKGQELCLES